MLTRMSFIRFLYDPDRERPTLNFGRFVDDAFGSPYVPYPTGSGPGSSSKAFTPSLDLHEDKVHNLITATVDLPGVTKDQVVIDVHKDRLVVSGYCHTHAAFPSSGSSSGSSSPDSESDARLGYPTSKSSNERRALTGKFSRTIPLPKGARLEDINARMERGVLTITFPPQPKARK